jgi:hypothetical protein
LLWVLALALRVAFFRGLDVQETLRDDGYRYAMLAWSLANRGVYSDAAEPPGYPTLLAPFYLGRDLSAGTEAALRVQVVAGSLLPILVVLAGRRLLPGWAVWLAGLLTACCPVLVTMPAFLVTESDFTVLLFLTLILLLRLRERPSARRAVLAGVVSGGLALVRRSALGLPAVVGFHLACRGADPNRRRAAFLLVAVAAAITVPWEVRDPHGAPAPSYVAPPLAEGIYPDLRYGTAARGYAFAADPRFPEFSTSIGKTLTELWERTRADPWPNLRWNLLGRWRTLWEFDMIQSPPIHIYPVRRGLFRPAAINPEGSDEPLAAFYWIFRRLHYFLIVPAVLVGAVLAVAGRHQAATRARGGGELLYVVLGYNVLLHSVLIPEPRFMLPMRPVLFLLAPATILELAALAAARRLRGALPLATRPAVRADGARRSGLVLLVGALLVALGLGEGLCRLLFRDRLAVVADERNLLYRYHPVLGWFPRPSERRSFVGERRIDVAHNALGFRDLEFEPHKTPGRPRIVFLGDSFVWGYDAEAEERFTNVLRRRHPEWEVLNLGVSGYGTDQECLLLEEFAPRLQPDVVVVEYNGVDRADNRLSVNHGGYGKPVFVQEHGSLRAANVPVPLSGTARYADSPLYRRSYLWRMILSARGISPSNPATADLTEALLDRMHDTAAAAGARFLVLLEGSDEALRRHAQERGYPLAEIEPALRARAAPDVPMRYPGHGMHWTPAGHLVVADVTERLLQEQLGGATAEDWFKRGRRLEERHAWFKAAAAYERARAADPQHVDAAMHAGLVYHYWLDDPARAVERYRAVLGLNSTHYGAHYQLAMALLAAGRLDEAREAWAAFVPLAEAIGDQKSIDSAPEVLSPR